MRKRYCILALGIVLLLSTSQTLEIVKGQISDKGSDQDAIVNFNLENLKYFDSIQTNYFIKNNGQIEDESILYYSSSGDIFFTSDGIIIRIREMEPIMEDGTFDEVSSMDPMMENIPGFFHEWGVVVKIGFMDSKPIEPSGGERCSWNSNYFRGPDPNGWYTDVPNFQEVIYPEIWDGIDLVYKVKNGCMKYDLIVSPGADPDDIIFRVSGHESLSVDSEGDLIIGTKYWDVKDSGLFAFQEDGQEIGCDFHLIGKDHYSFKVREYDVSKELVIDPLMNYSTFIGGSGDDRCSDVVTDSNGNPYITGFTSDSTTDYPTTTGAYDITHNGNLDAFVSKVSKDGSSLLYSTYIGGSNDDVGVEIEVDSSGFAYVVGRTGAGTTAFPTTVGSYDTTHNGGLDVFVTKINQTGSGLIFSSYLGGSNDDSGWGICLDSSNNVYLTGYSIGGSPSFPTTSNVFDGIHNGNKDAFITKIKSDGSDLIYSTFVGGSTDDTAHDITIDSDNNVYVAGTTDSSNFPSTTGTYSTSKSGKFDAFIFKLNQTGGKLIFSTFIGGDGNDHARGVCIDTHGNSYITGYCEYSSKPYPTTQGAYDRSHNGNYDIFITKINPTGGSLVFSTLYGGGSWDWTQTICLIENNPIVVGLTTDSSNDLPVTVGAYDSTHNGNEDVFMAIFNETGGTLIYSTYMGASQDDVAFSVCIGPENEIIFAGRSFDVSIDFPTTQGAYDTTHNGLKDVILVKFLDDTTPPSFGEDGSDKNSTTGDQYDFYVNAKDDSAISAVYVQYWFGTGPYTNVSMLGRGNNYSKSIMIPSNSLETLHYIFRARDTSGNWANTSQKNVSVYDNDPPTFDTNGSDGNATTGDSFDFKVYFNDNIETDSASVEYWFGDGTHTNVTMSGFSPFTNEITIPENSNSTLYYLFHANDTSDNWMQTDQYAADVYDNDIPIFLNDSSSLSGTTGEEFDFQVEVTDNIEVAEVEVEYWFNDESSITSSMTGPDTYTDSITISENATVLHYILHAEDTSGNINKTVQANITISDNDAPVFESDLSPSMGTTGDPFSFGVVVSDNIEVGSVYVEYWFDYGNHVNTSMSGSSTYSLSVNAPIDAMELLYIFRASDTSGNWKEYIQKNVTISDNDRPLFGLDLTPTFATTGDSLTFSINITDNLDIMSVHIEYWIGFGPKTNLSTSRTGSTFTTTITVPSDSLDRIRYIFHAVDDSGNWAMASEREIIVYDNDRPVFGIDNSNQNAYTGDPFSFSIEVIDNILVSGVSVEYWFDTGDQINTTMLGTGPYSISMNVPSNATSLRYIFHSVDGSGNWAQSPEIYREVKDNDKPKFGKDNTSNTATTGEKFRFEVDVTDNIEVSSVYVEYWFGDSYRENRSMEFDTFYHYTITIPLEKIEPLRYRFLAVDASDNWISRFRKDVNIIDNDMPRLTEDLSDDQAQTGDPFTFSMTVEDNIGIDQVTVEYWFGSQVHSIVTMESGDPITLEITVPSDSLDLLHYYFHICDLSENWMTSEEKTVIVIDNDPPSLKTDNSPSRVNTGDQITMDVEVEDNIEIEIVTLIWRFGSEGDYTSQNMVLESESYLLPIDIGGNSVEPLAYRIKIRDQSGLETTTPEHSIPVIDSIPPTIESVDDLESYESGKVKVTIDADDNIGISSYNWKGTPFNVIGNEMSGVTTTPGEFEITVEVLDAEGNSAETMFHLKVLPKDHDTDGDLIPDLIEMEWGLSMDDPSDGSEDSDNDGMNNSHEYLNGTYPFIDDTDEDGMPDGWEDRYGLDPTTPSSNNDADGDGKTDLEEYRDGTDPLVKDNDSDDVGFPFLLVLIIIILAIIIIIVAAYFFLINGRNKSEGKPQSESNESLPDIDDTLKSEMKDDSGNGLEK